MTKRWAVAAMLTVLCAMVLAGGTACAGGSASSVSEMVWLEGIPGDVPGVQGDTDSELAGLELPRFGERRDREDDECRDRDRDRHRDREDDGCRDRDRDRNRDPEDEKRRLEEEEDQQAG